MRSDSIGEYFQFSQPMELEPTHLRLQRAVAAMTGKRHQGCSVERIFGTDRVSKKRDRRTISDRTSGESRLSCFPRRPGESRCKIPQIPNARAGVFFDRQRKRLT
jgi:hypothetical protein